MTVQLIKHFTHSTDNYAGIFTCKENPEDPDKLFYSVTLWSRTKTLSDDAVAKMKSVLDKHQIKHSTLELMEQSDKICKPMLVRGSPVMKRSSSLLGL